MGWGQGWWGGDGREVVKPPAIPGGRRCNRSTSTVPGGGLQPSPPKGHLPGAAAGPEGGPQELYSQGRKDIHRHCHRQPQRPRGHGCCQAPAPPDKDGDWGPGLPGEPRAVRSPGCCQAPANPRQRRRLEARAARGVQVCRAMGSPGQHKVPTQKNHMCSLPRAPKGGPEWEAGGLALESWDNHAATHLSA